MRRCPPQKRGAVRQGCGEEYPRTDSPFHQGCSGVLRDFSLSEKEAEIARRILKEIRERLNFLVNVGLDYLSLDRTAGTLSGGEGQRIRLATQIGSSLVGVLYILDEPSIGLHQRDNARLLQTLKQLRDIGNTVLVVEHDEETILEADHVIDMGPGAGVHGGEVVAEGTPEEILAEPCLPYRQVSFRRTLHCGAEKAAQAGEVSEDRRGIGKQSQERRRGNPPRGDDLCHRGVRFGKIDARDRHAVPVLGQRLYRSREKAGLVKEITGACSFWTR